MGESWVDNGLIKERAQAGRQELGMATARGRMWGTEPPLAGPANGAIVLW